MNDLSNTEHQTTKIPDFILLNRSKVENVRLEEENKKLKLEIGNLKHRLNCVFDETKGTKKEQMYKKLSAEHNKACMTIHELKQKNEELICRIVQLSK